MNVKPVEIIHAIHSLQVHIRAHIEKTEGKNYRRACLFLRPFKCEQTTGEKPYEWKQCARIQSFSYFLHENSERDSSLIIIMNMDLPL